MANPVLGRARVQKDSAESSVKGTSQFATTAIARLWVLSPPGSAHLVT